MKKVFSLFVAGFLIFCFSCNQKTTVSYEVQKKTDKNGYSYESVSNDPINLRIYTLKNGLKVYLSVNKDEPRVEGMVSVKTGSKNDPAETSGLSHYFEHLMFKGTDKYGTSDWAKEKPLLDKISDLYQKHLATSDSLEKKKIYKEIDRVSQEAAKYALSSEYENMSLQVGTNGTNAFTNYDLTSYINNFPSCEMEKWLVLESERFRNPVLRLFHTELETVYEEFNISQQNDNWNANDVLMSSLFQKHTYGRPVIGYGKHLKNPSMVNILNYFKTYYVPNNMAIILSGDFDYEQTIQLIDKHFGSKITSASIPFPKFEAETPIDKPISKDVFGPRAENVVLGYRVGGAKSEDAKMITVISQLLNNYQAGLIDLNLVQKQKVQDAYCWGQILTDYGVLQIGATPREGQKLEVVKDLLLAEIEKLKKGEFDDWMLEAVVNNLRLQQINQLESNFRIYTLMDCFINDNSWDKELRKFDEMAKITKDQVMEFAKKTFSNNYVCVYKRFGKNNTAVHVEKPPISNIVLNRTEESTFMKDFKNIPSIKQQPVFLDFDKVIKKDEVHANVPFYYIKNITNELFSMYYILDMGKNHDKKLALAVQYLQFLGTSKYTPEAFKKEMYKLAVQLGVFTNDDRSYIYLSGLEKSFEKGTQLLENLLADVKPDTAIYNEFVKGQLKSRADNKKEKYYILYNAMNSYAKYGAKSPFTNILSEKEMRAINPKELTDILQGLYSYKHYIFYYGPKEPEAVKEILSRYHKVPEKLKEYPAPMEFAELDYSKTSVFLVDYDQIQADLSLITKAEKFDKNLMTDISFYNSYFGSGLSSIFFQEIREAKGLAYTAYCYYSIPDKPEKSHFIRAYVGTQPDKIGIALNSVFVILNEMPKSEKQFQAAKESLLKQIASERLIKENIFWTYLQNKERGINYDYRKEVYEKSKTITLDELNKFFEGHVKGKKYTIMVLGKKENIDKKLLSKFGECKELTLEELFNY